MAGPGHVAIIMDGNGRWAQQKLRPRIFGHIKGARVAKKIITRSVELGLSGLTLYAFSTENWMRPQEEVSFLMRLLGRYLKKEINNLIKQNIRFRVIGDIERLPPLIIEQIKNCTELTKNNTGLNLTFALNYGGRQEIICSVKKIAQDLKKQKIEISQINEELLTTLIETDSVGPPDLIMRTSGEMRLSNFLIWQAAYSELYFTKVLWPDFTVQDFEKALGEFSYRERRFGRTSEQVRINEL
jgi:undecaprenyl diphosphate synthase